MSHTSTQALGRINVPIAQTWNYLRINDVSFDVPTPESQGKVYEAVPRLFNQIETGLGEEATRWIVAAAGDGRYVDVPRGTHREEPIVVTTGAGTAANTAIMVRAGASATVVVVVGDEADQAPEADAAPLATSAALTRIFVEKGAQVSLVELVAAGAEREHLEGVGIRAERGAHVDVRQYALGGGKVAFGIAVDLAGDHSSLDLTTRYHASGSGLLDVNQLCRQRGRSTHAEMHASGVLADAASKTMRQTIDLVHGAKDAKGNESETVLVTGDDIVNKTLPTILCDEEDVAGNHGATIGSVSPEQLDYLAGRGLTREESEALFVRAIFDDAIINAPEARSRTAAIARAEEVLGADVAHDLAESLDPAAAECEEAPSC